MTFGNNVNEFYLSEVRKVCAKREKGLEKIKSPLEAKAYTDRIRKELSKIFGLPKHRSPLGAVTTGYEDFSDYTLEKVYYFSRPHFPVTGNLYLPKQREEKAPAALLLCGHSDEGKAFPGYQSMAVELALKGFIVLIIDPIEQGERRQFRDVENPRGSLCNNHNMLGKMLALTGEWFGTWRTYDGIRGLDYLEERPEVDGARLFVVGNSGGGTLTTWVAATDPRPIAVAPSCFVTSWLNDVENELPSDIEQIPPGVLAAGIDIPDFLLAYAPRPTLILGQKNDFFDPRGTENAAICNSKINTLLGGVPTECFIGPGSHGLSQENRNAVSNFFTRIAKPQKASNSDKVELPPLTSTLVVEGDVFSIPGAKNIRSFIIEKAEKLRKNRTKLQQEQMRERLFSLLKINTPSIPHYRVLRPVFEKKYWLSRFGLETEKDRIMAVLLGKEPVFHIDVDGKKVTILVPNLDGRQEIANHSVSNNEAIFALEVRGIGELTPMGCDQPKKRDFFAPYHSDYHYASVAMLLGKPIIGGKVKDLLMAIELLNEKGAKEIHLEGCGLGAIPALFATLLSDKVKMVRLLNGINSYEEELATSKTLVPLSYIVPGILKYMDIPEIRSVVSDRIVEG